MKENILKVVDELSKNKYFNNCSVELSINCKTILNYTKFNGNTMDYNNFVDKLNELKSLINDFSDEIKGYNLTLRAERGINRSDDVNYANDWKSVDITFWSGNDDSNPNPDELKYGMFEWRFLSDMESFDPSGIRSKLSKYIYKNQYDDHPQIDYGNYFEYDNVENVINSLIELDILIDKQYKEKCKIYDKIRLYI